MLKQCGNCAHYKAFVNYKMGTCLLMNTGKVYNEWCNNYTNKATDPKQLKMKIVDV